MFIIKRIDSVARSVNDHAAENGHETEELLGDYFKYKRKWLPNLNFSENIEFVDDITQAHIFTSRKKVDKIVDLFSRRYHDRVLSNISLRFITLMNDFVVTTVKDEIPVELRSCINDMKNSNYS